MCISPWPAAHFERQLVSLSVRSWKACHVLSSCPPIRRHYRIVNHVAATLLKSGMVGLTRVSANPLPFPPGVSIKACAAWFSSSGGNLTGRKFSLDGARSGICDSVTLELSVKMSKGAKGSQLTFHQVFSMIILRPP